MYLSISQLVNPLKYLNSPIIRCEKTLKSQARWMSHLLSKQVTYGLGPQCHLKRAAEG